MSGSINSEKTTLSEKQITLERQKGQVTLPVEAGKVNETLELIQRWGADAIRDSDGTTLSPEMLSMGPQVYSTICLARSDQEWARAHPEYLHQIYLMSHPITAIYERVEIDLLDGYFRKKYALDTLHEPKTWWEVIDRTSAQIVDPDQWEFQPGTGKVIVSGAQTYHVYTVSFLVYQTWDSTSMYNHITNNWQTPPIMSVDPYHPANYRYLMGYFDQWLESHPDTDIVRLTTLAYHFTLMSDQDGHDKYRDWLGYTDTVSPAALEDFELKYGYKLHPEDFVDSGYYNATYRVPSQKYLDWMDFIHDFVVRFGKDLVEQVHQAGKKAALFWGDHWIGVEPYSPRFQEMGVDINIGACEDGVALRRLADSPGDHVKEIRLYPYFFPDVFAPGGDPLGESQRNWVKIRRAMFRNGVDRIGYGGYLSRALEFPEFVDHVADLCDEFRQFQAHTQNTPVYTAPIRVAVLTAWGKLRSWINHIGPHEKFHTGRADVSEFVGSNTLESLAGLPVDVTFINFQEIEENGIPADVNIIINDGAAGTAWSGGRHWTNPKVVAAIRAWVADGGGFVGIGDPSAYEYQGRFYQLADVLGVQKEIGYSTQTSAIKAAEFTEHFITADLSKILDLGVEKSFVYPCDAETLILAADSTHVLLTANRYGDGRSVYLAGLPYNPQNARLLHRALFWAVQQEHELKRWFAENPNTDCAAFPETGFYVVANAVDTEQITRVHDGQGRAREVTLLPYASEWFETE